MLIYTAFYARYNDLSDPATVDLTAAVCNGVSHSQTAYDILNHTGTRRPQTSTYANDLFLYNSAKLATAKSPPLSKFLHAHRHRDNHRHNLLTD